MDKQKEKTTLKVDDDADECPKGNITTVVYKRREENDEDKPIKNRPRDHFMEAHLDRLYEVWKGY